MKTLKLWIISAQVINLTSRCFKVGLFGVFWGHWNGLLYLQSRANVYNIFDTDTVYETFKRQYDECVSCSLRTVSVLFMQQACKHCKHAINLSLLSSFSSPSLLWSWSWSSDLFMHQEGKHTIHLHELHTHLHHPLPRCDPDAHRHLDPVAFPCSKHASKSCTSLQSYFILSSLLSLSSMLTLFPQQLWGRQGTTDYMTRKEFIDPGFISTVRSMARLYTIYLLIDDRSAMIARPSQWWSFTGKGICLIDFWDCLIKLIVCFSSWLAK